MDFIAKVLIIYDNYFQVHYLKNVIENTDGFEVVKCLHHNRNIENFLENNRVDIIYVEEISCDYEIVKKIREYKKYIPIIVISDASNKNCIKEIAKEGVCTFLEYPFRPTEVESSAILAKEKVLQLMLKKSNEKCLKLINNFEYDLNNKILYKNGKEIVLTTKELTLIDFLARNRGVTINKEYILDYMQISDDSLRALIYRIRKNVDKELIKNSKKFGYKLQLDNNFI